MIDKMENIDHIIYEGKRYDAWVVYEFSRACDVCVRKDVPDCSTTRCRTWERNDSHNVAFPVSFERGAALTLEGVLEGKV